MIDLHGHILPGLDDGPADLDGSLAIARAHVAGGVHTVVGTPHVSWDYATTAPAIDDAVARLRAALADEAIPLTVLPGAEVALTRAIELGADELAGLRLGDGPWLLLEPPLSVDAPGLESMIGQVQARGNRVLIAHPERCIGFHRDPEMLDRLVRGGALAQVTASALTGFFGRTVQRLALDFADRGLIHVVASDAHDPVRRAPGIRPHLAAAGLEPLGAWLADAVPAAILAGEPIPPRPAFDPPRRSGERRRWLSRRR